MTYTVALCSLGCAKNLVDSERVLAIAESEGFQIIADFSLADIIIVNTCGFIAAAKQESIETILTYGAHKKDRCRALVVIGCMVQKYQKELAREIPEVDLWLGTQDFTTIGRELRRILPPKTEASAPLSPYKRLLTTPDHWAYVKIAEGCDNHCTFCTIPQLRGNYKSRPLEEIVDEVRALVRNGVREIVLLAQDTTVYGRDLYGQDKLKELLVALTKEDLRWIRVLYSYPHRLDDELLALMAREKKICSYLDIPMQHSEDNILKAMGRPERKEKLIRLIKRIREIDPDFVIRSTFIVGFPGETEANFQNLCRFIAEAKLDWVGVFPYSREEDTVAATLAEQLPEAVKEERYNVLMSLLSRNSAQVLEKWQGKTVSAVIEGKQGQDGEYSKIYQYFGRTSFQAPEVDGQIYIRTNRVHAVGDEIVVKVTKTDVYDLMGEEI